MQRVRRSCRSRVLAVLLALAVVLLSAGAPFGGSSATAASATDYVANCGVNLRASPSTSTTVVALISAGAVVTASGTVSGGSWSASCPSSVSGSTWYAITAVGGQSVSSRYGVAVVYGATRLFRAASTGTYLEGIDVSGWQGSVDWAKVKGAGKRFVIAKATEGIGFVDSKWVTNKNGAMNAGLALTGYHFARPDLNPTNPAGEADWFVNNLGLVPGMVVPALDLEVRGSLGTTALQNWVAAWLARVYARTGARAMIYTSPAFWKSYLGDTTMFADQGYTALWVAHWGVSQPTVPASNWGGRGWTFWQYTSNGSVPGISGRVDLDRYNGTDFTRVTFGADFAPSAAPSSQSVKQGGSTSYTISLGRTYFTLPIDLSISGLPAGTTASFSSDPATGASSTLTVTSSKSGTITPVGTYVLTITGVSNGLTRKAPATLVVKDGIPPTVVSPASRLYYPSTLGSTTAPVRTNWSAADPSGIASYQLQRQVNGGSWSTVSLASATATTVKQSLSRGDTWRYRVRATDGAGNVSAYAYGPSFVPRLVQQSSSAVRYGGTWKTASATSYSGGSVKYAKSAGAWASYTFTGASVGWVAEKGPTRGSAKVYIDGAYKTTISLYASSYQARQIVYTFSWTSNGTHMIKIVVVGTAGHPRVDVDAFVRLVRT